VRGARRTGGDRVSAHPEVILASGSPRRRAILAEAGVRATVLVPAIDDATAPADGRNPAAYVMSLAWFKARQAMADAQAAFGQSGPRWIVAADTMCVRDGAVIGKPADRAEAEAMIRGFAGRAHSVVTGVCIVDRATGARTIFSDEAHVTLGPLGDAVLATYLAGDGWRGKAGGYNYADRVADGWPLACDGDPETVMGLPSAAVLRALERMCAEAGA
jgi:septum formation protein